MVMIGAGLDNCQDRNILQNKADMVDERERWRWRYTHLAYTEQYVVQRAQGHQSVLPLADSTTRWDLTLHHVTLAAARTTHPLHPPPVVPHIDVCQRVHKLDEVGNDSVQAIGGHLPSDVIRERSTGSRDPPEIVGTEVGSGAKIG